MSLKPLKLALALTILAATFAFAHATDNPQPQSTPPPAAPQVRKWEYATMRLGGAPLWQSGKGYIQEAGNRFPKARRTADSRELKGQT